MVSPGAAFRRVLLVEGVDDKHVVGHLCERAGIADDFEFKDKNGIDGLLRSISVEAKTPDLASLGIRWEFPQCPPAMTLKPHVPVLEPVCCRYLLPLQALWPRLPASRTAPSVSRVVIWCRRH